MLLYAYVRTSSSDAIDCCGESDSGFRTDDSESPELFRLNSSSLSLPSSSLSDSICSTEICREPLRGGGDSDVIPGISGDCSGGGGRRGDTIGCTADMGDCGGEGEIIRKLGSFWNVVIGSPIGVGGRE